MTNKNEMTFMVKDFHKAFNHPIANSPQPLELNRATNRAVWTGEECLIEFVHQSCKNEEEFLAKYDELIAGMEKAKQKSLGMEYPKSDLDMMTGQADALIDALYFINGSFVEMGLLPFKLFEIVQGANMGKLHSVNGEMKAVYREDGKILKPENWEKDFAPEERLRNEIFRQIQLATEKGDD